MIDRQISAAIAGLSSSDPAARSAAAAQLYNLGAEQAASATATWRNDPDLFALFTGEPTVGVAVHPETFSRIRAANGDPRLADVPPDQDALEFELHVPPKISLDILTTRDPSGSGAIARFLARRGEAIQQVELPVADVDRATALLGDRFHLAPVYPTTRPGADDTRVNFFLIAATDGSKILIELVEPWTPASRHP